MNLEFILSIIPDNIEGVIFDLDGTLADTMPLHIMAWEDTGKSLNIPITAQVINEYAGAPSHVVLQRMNERFGWTVDPEMGRKMKSEKYYEILDNNGGVKAIGPVFDYMVTISGKLPMSIGTGSNSYSAHKVMKLIGADAYIDIVVTADDVNEHKPHPETFLKCADRMGIAPEKCLVFEDGAMGILAAKHAQMSAILVPDYSLIKH